MKTPNNKLTILLLLLLICITFALCVNQNTTETTTSTTLEQTTTTTIQTTSTTQVTNKTIISRQENNPNLTGLFRINISAEGAIINDRPTKLKEDVIVNDRPIYLTVTVWSSVKARYPNTSINISLSDDFFVYKGNISWQGDLEENQTVKLISQVVTVKTGENKISVTVSYKENETLESESDSLIILVGENLFKKAV